MKENLKQKLKLKAHFFGTFIELNYDDSIDELNDWVKENVKDGELLDKLQYHTTVHYSRKGNFYAERESKPVKIKVEVIGLELLGENKDILVALVKSPQIEEMHKELKRKYNLSYDWPEYLPHISIAKTNKLPKTKIPHMELTTSYMIVKPLDPEFSY